MFTVTTFNCHAPIALRKISLQSLRRTAVLCRSATSQKWYRLGFIRYESTAARQARTRQPAKYPEDLNVFLAPTIQTAFAGCTRVATIGVLLYGVFIMAPGVYFNDEASNWWIPISIIGSGVPLAVVIFVGAPFVSSIRIKLPSHARQSKEALMRFASNTPPDTLLRVQYLRFAPWLQTRQLWFSDLRRLPFSRWRLSNLEHVPFWTAEEMSKSGVWGGFVKRYFGRYWINMAQFRDRSAVPGVWQKMWEQIPVVGMDRQSRREVTRIATTMVRPEPTARPAQRPGRRKL